MSGTNITAKFFVREANLLVEQSRLVDYLSTFAQVGYRLASLEEKAAGMAWRGINYGYANGRTPSPEEKALDWNLLFTPGLSTQALREIDDFCAYGGQLGLIAYSTERSGDLQGYYFFLYFTPEQNLVDLVGDSNDIRGKEHEERWENLLDMTYSAWHPIYAYPLVPYSTVHITRDDALSHPIRYLFPFNFWGPEIVDQFGLQKVLATPSAEVVELVDGGVYLKPRIGDEAAAYLGLTSQP